MNLGVNARDAMPGGGTLTISTRDEVIDESVARTLGEGVSPGEYVCFSFRDSGCGMDSETRSHIFEPFFTTKATGRGTGLGLSTVYGIVMQSRGAITVESESGKGSTFTISLPRAEGAINPVTQMPAPLQAAGNSETVLVVEDEEVVRTFICAVLSEMGYDVLCAGSPTEALRLVDQQHGPIHLLVSDVVMPEMHGPALAAIFAPLMPGMRVLYVSGYSESDISDQGVIDPTLEVLQKPFSRETLIRKVRELLDGDRQSEVPDAISGQKK